MTIEKQIAEIIHLTSRTVQPEDTATGWQPVAEDRIELIRQRAQALAATYTKEYTS